mmetsp:Transcript_74193/g.193161  ORF Transcript_74193/g.193161 Transcript_74193/m.193161 type:complete len:219 (-) Transcript_74193:619-1275(-)
MAVLPPRPSPGSCGSMPPSTWRGVSANEKRPPLRPTWCSMFKRASVSSASRASKEKSRASLTFAGSGMACTHFATFCSRLDKFLEIVPTSLARSDSSSPAVRDRELRTSPSWPPKSCLAPWRPPVSSHSWRSAPAWSSPTEVVKESTFPVSSCARIRVSSSHTLSSSATSSIFVASLGTLTFKASNSTRATSAFTCILFRYAFTGLKFFSSTRTSCAP